MNVLFVINQPESILLVSIRYTIAYKNYTSHMVEQVIESLNNVCASLVEDSKNLLPRNTLVYPIPWSLWNFPPIIAPLS